MIYAVRKNWLGKRHVHYRCPHCKADLESPLEEAGRDFPCPTCQSPFKVPGEVELRALKEAEVRAHLHAAAQRKSEREPAAKKQSAQAPQPRPVPTTPASSPPQTKKAAARGPRKDSVADRFLTFTFGFAKVISVAVIGICFATIIVCLIILAFVHSQPKSVEIPEVKPFAAPTVSDYDEFKSSQQASNAPVAEQPSSVQGTNQALPVQQLTAGQQLSQLLSRLNDQFSLNGAAYEFSPSDDAGQEALLSGLNEFAQEYERSGRTLDRDTLLWFLGRFSADWRQHLQSQADVADARARAEEEVRIADAEAGAKRQQIVIVIGMSIGAIMSFLFLPLLIQIENNTRRSLQELVDSGRSGQASATERSKPSVSAQDSSESVPLI